MTEYLIACDLGTGGMKATLYDRALSPVAETFAAYPTYYPAPEWHEQSIGDWWNALVFCTHDLIRMSGAEPQSIRGIALSGASLVAVPIGKDGLPLCERVPIWSDKRAVREAEALITLVPLDSEIELEAEIRPQDIGKVHIGSEVRVKLNSFPFQKHGTLDGVVRTISEDSFEKQQGEPGSARTYYRARITLSGHLRNVKEDFRLIPGMECQAEIKVGERRIIEYLIHPLIKSLDESMREP